MFRGKFESATPQSETTDTGFPGIYAPDCAIEQIAACSGGRAMGSRRAGVGHRDEYDAAPLAIECVNDVRNLMYLTYCPATACPRPIYGFDGMDRHDFPKIKVESTKK